MPRLTPIRGGGRGGLDPRRARLARVHDLAILGIALCAGGFLAVGLTLIAAEWGPTPVWWGRLALFALGVSAVFCVMTVFMVAMVFDADPRTIREQRQGPEPDDG